MMPDLRSSEITVIRHRQRIIAVVRGSETANVWMGLKTRLGRDRPVGGTLARE